MNLVNNSKIFYKEINCMVNEKKNEDDLGFECSSIAEEMLYADVLREFEQGKIIENLWENH